MYVKHVRKGEIESPGGRFSKVPKSFQTPKAIFLMWTEVSFLHEVWGVYASLFLDRLTKNGFPGPKRLRGFREVGLGAIWPVRCVTAP